MKSVFYYLQGSKEKWADEAASQLEIKIGHFMPFKLVALKSKSHSRESAKEKTKQEEQKLLSVFSKDDFIILFDEKGKLHSDSRKFSKDLVRAIESGKHRLVFVIGGPYGFTDELRSRANLLLSLSPLTMNHFVAKITALEQIYRGLTIWKGVKYHND